METYDAVLITGLVLCCCAGFLIGIQLLRRRRAMDHIADRNRVDMAKMIDEVGTMQTRLDTLSHGLRRLVQSVEQLQLGSKTTHGFDQASTLARSGASTEQLVEQCGVTRGEADLLRRLNTQGSGQRNRTKSYVRQ